MISNEHLFHRCHFFRLYAIILIDARRFTNDSNRRLKWTSPIYYFGQVAWISQPLWERVQRKNYIILLKTAQRNICVKCMDGRDAMKPIFRWVHRKTSGFFFRRRTFFSRLAQFKILPSIRNNELTKVGGKKKQIWHFQYQNRVDLVFHDEKFPLNCAFKCI